jgi:peptidoglycan/xylan/chitin deacetylase (PgdA/CDA1 family)
MNRFILQVVFLFFVLFSYGQSNRLAILDICERNDEINKENLASAIHMAEVAGMPYIVTTTVGESLTHPFVLVTSSLRDETLTSNETSLLINYVSSGGILIAPFIKSTYYFDLFGINYTKLESNRYWLKWNIDDNHPELNWINEDAEKELPLADMEHYRSIYTRGYITDGANVLAHFDDNKAAITKHTYGLGKSFALGFELKDVVLRNLMRKDYSTNRMYSNGFEPTTDMFLLFLRAIYTSNKAVAIHKHTSPGNSSSALLITHDVDSNTGMDSMFYFSEWEANNGIKAHYFITTRYFSDGLMSDFYREEHFSKMRDLLAYGHQIGSHSVGHFPDFADRTLFPIGEEGNTMESYQPAYHDGSTSGGMLTAELEVSRDLLQADIGANVRSFRSGYLAFNLRLINVMSNLEYAFNSTNSANDVLTNFPYRQRTSNAFSGIPTEVYEMPMTISDASKSLKLSEETIDEVVGKWVDVLYKNNDNHAPTVLLIHPNRGWKLGALQRIIQEKPSSVIPFEFNAFGDYWLERRDLDFDYTINENNLSIQFVNDNTISEQQSIIISNGRNLEGIEMLNLSGEAITFQTEEWKDNDLIITHIGASIIDESDPDPDPKQYTLIINSKDENSQDLNDVNWVVLSADSTLIGEGNTGSNAQDILLFTNTNRNTDIILKTHKTEYTDYRIALNIPAEQEVVITSTNSLLRYDYSLDVTAKDSATETELDFIKVKAFLNGILLMEGESLENTVAELETTQSGHALDIEVIIEKTDYVTSDSISITINEDQANSLTYNLIKEIVTIPAEILDYHRLAIWDNTAANNEANKENLAGAVQMADVAGIPYAITEDLDMAIKMDFILITSSLKVETISSTQVEILKSYVKNGGILLAPFIKNTELFELFGIETTKLDKYRYTLSWTEEQSFSELKWLDDPLEKSIPLANPNYYKSIYTRGYTVSRALPMAYFEDNKVAVCRNDYGNGKAYAFGVEWKDVILRNLLNKDYSAQRTYSNGFEPTTDVFMLLLRAVFTENQEVSVYKHTSPGESTSALLITHDVDSRTIIATMPYFSNWEFIQGISTHYFVTTHYLKDDYMSAYYEEENFDKIRELLERNHTIGSHSVAHSPDFSRTSVFPIGAAGNTQYSYQPLYNGSITIGGTVYGELEVSRDLLNSDIGADVRSFRSGALAFNIRLPNVLDELAYSFNSSMSANNVLTNFPYFQRTNKAFSGSQTNVLELPLTLTDISSSHKLEENNIDEVVDIWSDVITRNNRNNAPSVLLISPNREWKLQAMQQLLLNIPEGVITYNFEDFGDYWLDRKELDFDYYLNEGILSIELKSDNIPAEDLGLIIENGANISQFLVKNSSGNNVAFFVKDWNSEDKLITFGQQSQSIREKRTTKIDVPSLIEESQFNLFPNPANGFVNLLFDMEIKEEFKLKIIEMSGRLVDTYAGTTEEGSSMLRIDLSSYKRGIYLINFETATINKTLKLSVVD